MEFRNVSRSCNNNDEYVCIDAMKPHKLSKITKGHMWPSYLRIYLRIIQTFESRHFTHSLMYNFLIVKFQLHPFYKEIEEVRNEPDDGAYSLVNLLCCLHRRSAVKKVFAFFLISGYSTFVTLTCFRLSIKFQELDKHNLRKIQNAVFK